MANAINILTASRYLILKFQNDGIPLTPLKLQKLLYYLQAWHAVFFDRHPLYSEEPEAWSNGPVYRSVYNEYKNQWLRNEPIILSFEENNILNELKVTYDSLKLDSDQQEYMGKLLSQYGPVAPERLVFMTHSESPWNEAREGCGPFDKCTQKITIQSMYDYYGKRTGKKS